MVLLASSECNPERSDLSRSDDAGGTTSGGRPGPAGV